MEKTGFKLATCVKLFYWKMPIPILFRMIQLRSGMKFSKKTKIKKISGLIQISQESSRGSLESIDSTIFFYHPQRISRYFIGVDERLDKLLAEYLIDQIEDFNPGLVIDIGSNIGEFSLAIGKRFPNSRTIRFEPSVTEGMASLWNLRNMQSELITRALWSEQTTLEFFMANESGDSSLFKPRENLKSEKIEVSTLDLELRSSGATIIELVKLEAEGAEPEILLGAPNVLRRTRYLVADLGPERGLEQSPTFNEANSILVKSGFSLKAKNVQGRECYLYKNILIENSK